jgi:hypothetical protein
MRAKSRLREKKCEAVNDDDIAVTDMGDMSFFHVTASKVQKIFKGFYARKFILPFLRIKLQSKLFNKRRIEKRISIQYERFTSYAPCELILLQTEVMINHEKESINSYIDHIDY